MQIDSFLLSTNFTKPLAAPRRPSYAVNSGATFSEWALSEDIMGLSLPERLSAAAAALMSAATTSVWLRSRSRKRQTPLPNTP